MQATASSYSPSGVPQVRYHALDALRAFALILGIVFHATLSFVPGIPNWAVQDRSTCQFLGYFVVVSHSFRLEIFFLIAGFFGHLVFHSRGFKRFARDRARRILLPYVVGWLVVAPALTFVWLLGDDWKAGSAAVTAILELLARFVGARPGFLARTHLWFLYYLLLVYAAALALRWLFDRFTDPAGRRRGRIDGWLRRLIESRLAVPVLAACCTGFLWGMEGWGVDTPEASLVPHLPAALLYGFFFSLGWLMHRQPALLEVIARRWWTNLLLGLILSLPTVGVLARAIAEGGTQLKIVFVPLYALMMWLLVFGVMGLFLRFFETPSSGWRYVADSSYWLYIAHLPLVTFLQVAFANAAWPWILKLLLINLICFPILLLSYHYLVRSTFIGETLNGKRSPFIPLSRLWRPERSSTPDPREA